MKEITNEKYELNSPGCECFEDITHDSQGQEEHFLRIKNDPAQRKRFAYMPHEGLVRMNIMTGAVERKNILGDWLCIKKGDTKKMLTFFSDNGFLFPIGSNNLETMDFNIIFEIQQRVKVTLDLIECLHRKRIPYEKMMNNLSWLTFSPRIEIQTGDANKPVFRTCEHSYCRYLAAAQNGNYDAVLNDPRLPEVISVKDTIYSEGHDVYLGQEAWDYMDVEPSVSSGWILGRDDAKRIYVCERDAEQHDRKVIDYFYNLTQEVGRITSINKTDASVNFYEIEKKWKDKVELSPALKKATLDVTKITVKEELDYAINAIYPSYDIETMTGSWIIPDLYAALLFSLFYMKADVELYRQCENPSCGRYFLVNASNSKRKYCSQACSNAMQQRKMRAKKKAGL